MEAELKKSFPTIEISLISSGGGVFEVALDEKLIFSKKALNRFPVREVEDMIQEQINAQNNLNPATERLK